MKPLILSLAILSLIVVSGCVTDINGTIQLNGTEVSEYEGKDLTPVSGLRDVSIKGPQNVDIGSYRLKVHGLVESPRDLTYQEVLSRQRYSKVVTLDCVLGWSSTNLWEGVLVSDLIEEAGPNPEANTVIFRAVDGYSTSFPLDYVQDNQIILASKINNVTLDARTGYPFKLAAEDKWGYKWISWVSEIELSDDPNFRGYWESRGYSNDGGTDKGFYE